MPEMIKMTEKNTVDKATKVASLPTNSRNGLPNCVGKDLRDAINLINSRGCTPYAVGFGKVHRQIPPAGSSITPAAVCTLYCSVEG